MAACARAVQQADGSFVLVLDPAATDLSACPYAVQSGAEASNGLFAMTAQDGAEAAAAIVSVWIVAYSFRALILMLRGHSNE